MPGNLMEVFKQRVLKFVLHVRLLVRFEGRLWFTRKRRLKGHSFAKIIAESPGQRQ